MNNNRLYLDYNATAPVLVEAREAALAAMALNGNPSSVHAEGRDARAVVESARGDIAALIGARPQEIIFTSGGTEANILALHGARTGPLIVSAIEHDSVLVAAKSCGRTLHICPVLPNGVLDMEALDVLLDQMDAPPLVSVMLANNETGVIQPISAITERVHGKGGLMHCDAVQAGGRLPISVHELGVDLLTLSGHKMGALKGAGVLWARGSVVITAQATGGGQELGRRSGTENVPGIASFGAAARIAMETAEKTSHLADLRDMLESGLAAITSEGTVFGQDAPRLCNTVSVRMPGLAAETQVMSFDLEGIAISAGSACSSGKVRPSHVLEAMGVSHEASSQAIRVSLGPETTKEDVSRFLAAWEKIYVRHKRRMAVS